MKTIKLFVKFAFTSLSPDAQPISLGIASDDDKAFYAEFTDFDINRCDDWVKENVISKLQHGGKENIAGHHCFNNSICGDTDRIKTYLKAWLGQFKGFDIQFVTDCGWFNWNWMVQLLGEWDVKFINPGYLIPANAIPEGVTIEDIKRELKQGEFLSIDSSLVESISQEYYKVGLPKLSSNISPVPEDLNDLIAREKGISVREAFELDRQALAWNPVLYNQKKFNALFDAEVIKTIYNDLVR